MGFCPRSPRFHCSGLGCAGLGILRERGALRSSLSFPRIRTSSSSRLLLWSRKPHTFAPRFDRRYEAKARWDAALFLGIGIALSADEVGLLFPIVPYRSLTSLLVPLGLGLALLPGASNAVKRNVARELLVLDHNDTLTVATVLLSIFCILAKPFSAWKLAPEKKLGGLEILGD